MHEFLRSLPVRAKWLLVLAAFGLVASLFGNISVLSHVGEPSLGVYTYWDMLYGCYRVSPTTPVTWPGLQLDLVQVGDCIDRVEEIDFRDQTATRQYLERQLQKNWSEHHVHITASRRVGDMTEELAVVMPIMWLSWTHMLGIQLGLLIPGLAVWGLGIFVLLAQPRLEENQVLAAFLILGGVSIMGASEDWKQPYVEVVYIWLIVGGVRPFLGALLFHLAQIWPEPVTRYKPMWLRTSVYTLAVFTFLLSALDPLGNIYPNPRSAAAAIISHSLIALLFALGIGMFLGRSLLVWRTSASPRTARQARYFFVAILFSAPLILADVVIHQLNLPWKITGNSNIAVVFLILPSIGLVAYSMLRYQTFAYRGKALNALLVLMVSTTLTALYALFLAPHGWDGVQFVTVWGATLLATLFWFVDSPLRRGFRRLFVRHEYDYEIANRFSVHMASAQGVEQTLSIAAAVLCTELEVAWGAISSIHRPGNIWLALADQPDVLSRPVDVEPPDSVLPDLPAHKHAMTENNRLVGTLWIGARTTAEPFDKKDAQLVALLSQELVRSLSVHAHIEELEQVPGQILTALDSDRRRIGQDFHDGVLQYLGAIPLDLDRAAMMIDTDPAKTQAILERYTDQATVISQETRSIVYDLSPPGLAESRLLIQTKNHVQQVCVAQQVQWKWRATGEAWNRLDEGQALHVYRIVQQAVSNALQHANATEISIDLSQQEEILTLRVSDIGWGFDQTQVETKTQVGMMTGGLGIVSMRERARVLGGSLEIKSVAGAGTTVIVAFPVSQNPRS